MSYFKGGVKMTLEINKLIDSEFEMLRKLGWLLYEREDRNGGLNLEEVYKLLHIVNVEEMEKEYKAAYDEGFDDAICE
jgi:hypothetical protein